MADIASELATRCGISTEAAQRGLGVVLALLKSKLPEETFSKISSAVPNADSMMAAAADISEPSGGMMEVVKGALGKIFGGGTDALLAKFANLGLTPEQIHEFIPKVMEFLKGKLPDNVMNQVTALLPTTQEAAH